MSEDVWIQTPLMRTKISTREKMGGFSADWEVQQGPFAGETGWFTTSEDRSVYTSTGGTRQYCPSCQRVRLCAAEPALLRGRGEARRYHVEHTDLHWFQRGRRCRSCLYPFITVEIDHAVVNELVALRDRIVEGEPVSTDDLMRLADNIVPLKRP